MLATLKMGNGTVIKAVIDVIITIIYKLNYH
ncbi:hypothetical protein ERAN111884_02920 [Erysipelothrix anatis]